MADLVAVPTETMILGMPLMYFLVLVAIGVVIMLIGFVFLWYWLKTGPCREYFTVAMFGNGEMGLIARASGRASFIKTKYVTGVFNAIDYPLSWIQRSFEAFRFGAVNLKILCDISGIAVEPSLQQAIKETVVEWNDREIRRDFKAREDGRNYIPQYLQGYKDIYNLLVEGVGPDGKDYEIPEFVNIRAIFEVPVYTVKRYIPRIGAGDLEGHIQRRMYEDVDKEEPRKMFPDWFYLGIAVVAIIIILFVIMNYFLTSGGK